MSRKRSSVLRGCPVILPPVCDTLESYSLRFLFSSSRVLIFFCRERMDFHFISNLLPSGSTSASEMAMSREKAYALAVYYPLARY